MRRRELRFFVAMAAVCFAAMLPVLGRAAGAADEVFAAMRVDKVVPPRPAANLVLRAIDGTPIRLADFKGKIVVVGFLMAN